MMNIVEETGDGNVCKNLFMIWFFVSLGRMKRRTTKIWSKGKFNNYAGNFHESDNYRIRILAGNPQEMWHFKKVSEEWTSIETEFN